MQNNKLNKNESMLYHFNWVVLFYTLDVFFFTTGYPQISKCCPVKRYFHYYSIVFSTLDSVSHSVVQLKDGEARYSHSGPPPEAGETVCGFRETAYSAAER